MEFFTAFAIVTLLCSSGSSDSGGIGWGLSVFSSLELAALAIEFEVFTLLGSSSGSSGTGGVIRELAISSSPEPVEVGTLPGVV